MKNKIILLAFMAALLFSCEEKQPVISPEQNSFMEKVDDGLVIGTAYKLKFNELTHQMSVNSQRKIYRLQSDNQSEYFVAKYSQSSTNIGEVLPITIESYNGTLTSESLDMEVVKMVGMRLWLWNNEKQTGVIIRTK